MSLSQDNDMEGFSSRRAIGIVKESKPPSGFYHGTVPAGSSGGTVREKKNRQRSGRTPSVSWSLALGQTDVCPSAQSQALSCSTDEQRMTQ